MLRVPRYNIVRPKDHSQMFRALEYNKVQPKNITKHLYSQNIVEFSL